MSEEARCSDEVSYENILLATSRRQTLTPEEVRVETSLHQAGNDGDGIDEGLCKIPVNPIGNVERPVCSQRKEVMCGDRFCLSCPLQHEELWQNSDGLEVDGEGPAELEEVVAVVEEQS